MTLINDRLTALAEAVTALRAAIVSGALQRMAEATVGPPAASITGGGGRSGLFADPTAAAALSQGSTGDQLGTLHRAELDRLIQRATDLVQQAVALTTLYPEPRVADASDRAALARINGRQEPGCDNCARILGPAGTSRWEPIDSRLSNPLAVGDEAMWLCAWCNGRFKAWGRLPTPDELRRHHNGQIVAWPADVERPPDRRRSS
jgi:hypothetical protein